MVFAGSLQEEVCSVLQGVQGSGSGDGVMRSWKKKLSEPRHTPRDWLDLCEVSCIVRALFRCSKNPMFANMFSCSNNFSGVRTIVFVFEQFSGVRTLVFGVRTIFRCSNIRFRCSNNFPVFEQFFRCSNISVHIAFVLELTTTQCSNNVPGVRTFL